MQVLVPGLKPPREFASTLKGVDMSKESSDETKPRRLALEVPKGVNLAKMSDAEIEKLALDMSRKVAGSLPKGSAVGGVEGVTLMQRTGIGVEVGWSRGCGRAEVSREGLVVNPEVFVDPFRAEDIAGKSGRITINTKGKAATAATRKSKKK
jgi:hypothetical protein